MAEITRKLASFILPGDFFTKIKQNNSQLNLTIFRLGGGHIVSHCAPLQVFALLC